MPCETCLRHNSSTIWQQARWALNSITRRAGRAIRSCRRHSIGAWYHYVGVLSECTIQLPKMQPAVPANSSKGALATESEPASTVPEPLALGLPVIQNTASRHSHIVLLSLQPSRVSLTTLNQRTFSDQIELANPRSVPPVRIREAHGSSLLGALS